MRKNKIGRENIFKIKSETQRIRCILLEIDKYAEGYANPLDTLIYSKREMSLLKQLKETERKLQKEIKLTDFLRRIYKRDCSKSKTRICSQSSEDEKEE